MIMYVFTYDIHKMYLKCIICIIRVHHIYISCSSRLLFHTCMIMVHASNACVIHTHTQTEVICVP
jgi:hypothetical protein